jgi:hypothetical protein
VALTNCYECSGKVSTLAASCPHCGAPFPKPSISREEWGELDTISRLEQEELYKARLSFLSVMKAYQARLQREDEDLEIPPDHWEPDGLDTKKDALRLMEERNFRLKMEVLQKKVDQARNEREKLIEQEPLQKMVDMSCSQNDESKGIGPKPELSNQELREEILANNAVPVTCIDCRKVYGIHNLEEDEEYVCPYCEKETKCRFAAECPSCNQYMGFNSGGTEVFLEIGKAMVEQVINPAQGVSTLLGFVGSLLDSVPSGIRGVWSHCCTGFIKCPTCEHLTLESKFTGLSALKCAGCSSQYRSP